VLVGGDGGEVLGGTVDGGGRGVDEGDGAVEGEVEDFFGGGEVVVHHVAAVVLEGVGAGALMEDGADGSVGEVAGGEGAAEFCFVEVVGELCAVEVEEFALRVGGDFLSGWGGRGGEIVDDEDVGVACGVEFVDEVGADEAGASGDDDHDLDCTAAGALAGRRDKFKCNSRFLRFAATLPRLCSGRNDTSLRK